MNWHPTFDPIGDGTRLRLVVRNETKAALATVRLSATEPDDAVIGRLVSLHREITQADTTGLTGRGARRLLRRLKGITEGKGV